MGDTSIEWAHKVWNPVAGCSVVSPGCTNCYAMKMAARIERMGIAPHYVGLTMKTKAGAVWTGKIAEAPGHIMAAPLHWKKPARVFVNSMADLFHDGVPDETIDRVFAVMAICPHLTFMVLTKRADRMRAYMNGNYGMRLGGELMKSARGHAGSEAAAIGIAHRITVERQPLPNVWLGVSVEDQQRADERIPDLLQTPAAVRFLSCEPLLGPLHLHEYLLGFAAGHPAACACGHGHGFDRCPNYGRVVQSCHRCDCRKFRKALGADGIHLAIIGGESGPRSRRLWVPDVRSIVRQCQNAGVATFVKQMGANVTDRNDADFDGCENGWKLDDPVAQVEHDIGGSHDEYQGAPVRIHLRDRKGADMAEWPEDLRVRELPT